MKHPKLGQTVLIPRTSDKSQSLIPLDVIEAVYSDIEHTERGELFTVRVKSGDTVQVRNTDKGWRAIC